MVVGRGNYYNTKVLAIVHAGTHDALALITDTRQHEKDNLRWSISGTAVPLPGAAFRSLSRIGPP